MNARPVRRIAAGITAFALAGLGLAVGMTAASAADTITPDQHFAGSFYLVDNTTGEDIDAGTQLLWNQVVVAVPTPGDLATALPEPAAPHDGVVQFLAPQGQEGDITKWNAYSPLPLISGGQWLQDVTPTSLLNNGQGTIKGGSAVANAGGDYSIGIAYTTNNNNTLVAGGEYFIHIHVTANANAAAATYTWQPVQTQQVGPVDTDTVLSAPASGHAGLPVPITANVTAVNGSTPTGSLVITGQLGADAPVTLGSVAGTHLAISPASLTEGTWTITASFDGTDGAYNDSSDVTTIAVTVLTAEPDEQTVTVDIPEGVLTITTPYSAASPLALGVAAFDEVNSTFSASAAFGDDADITKAIKILDRRPGDLGFTASVSSTNFTTGTGTADETIDAAKGSLTELAATQVPFNALNPTDLTLTDRVLSTSGQSFAAYPAGKAIGAAWISGTFSIDDVPSSVVGGLYTATLTFTVE